MDMLDCQTLHDQLRASRRLPSPPGTAIRALAICRDENTDIQVLTEIVASDPALAARVLKFANSSTTGVGRQVITIRDAVRALGLRAVKLISLGFAISPPDLETWDYAFDLHRFWCESYARAVIARRLAGIIPGTDREFAFTVGLLARVGQLAFRQGLSEDYEGILRMASDTGRRVHLVETESIGINHAQFGAFLLAQWEIPEVLTEVLSTQYMTDIEDDEKRRFNEILRIADHMVPNLIPKGESDEDALLEIRGAVSPIMDIGPDLWIVTCQDIVIEYQSMVAIFDARVENHREVMDLYAKAQEEATNVSMITQIEKAQAVVEQRDLLRRATTDPLTGIANRAKFDERLDETLIDIGEGTGELALLIFDVDHFKKFNDEHGHQVGDLVLKRVASTVKGILPKGALLARYGGEEFAVIFPRPKPQEPTLFAARINKTLQDMRVEANEMELSVTVSVGVAFSGDYDECPTAGNLIADADAEMYQAKNAGRNTFSYRGCTGRGQRDAQAA